MRELLIKTAEVLTPDYIENIPLSNLISGVVYAWKSFFPLNINVSFDGNESLRYIFADNSTTEIVVTAS